MHPSPDFFFHPLIVCHSTIDNIVPTSGMRACTAVVTEIAYHAKNTIDADVSFLSEAEWRQELGVLLQDLVDEDGNLKRTTNLNSEVGIAWQKVCFLFSVVRFESGSIH
jgi:hypothetical protein